MALPGHARGEERRAGRRRLTEAPRRDVGLERLHRVVDREHRGRRASGGVDVEGDVAPGVLRLQEEELRDDRVAAGVVELAGEEHDPLLE